MARRVRSRALREVRRAARPGWSEAAGEGARRLLGRGLAGTFALNAPIPPRSSALSGGAGGGLSADHRGQGAAARRELLELLAVQRLRAVTQRGGGVGVDVDDDGVGTRA